MVIFRALAIDFLVIILLSLILFNNKILKSLTNDDF